MTDDEKLREIISEVSAEPFISEYKEMYDVGYDAMKWKKEQMIDKACEWWENELTYPTMSAVEIDWLQTKIVAFRKEMMEE